MEKRMSNGDGGGCCGCILVLMGLIACVFLVGVLIRVTIWVIP